MNKISHSLSMKLSLGILLMAIPIFVLSLGALFLQSRYFIRNEASEDVNSLVNTALHRARSHMSTVETATNANAWLLEEQFHPDSLSAISHRIVQLNRNVYGCSISTEPDVFPQYGRYFSVYTFNEGDTVITVHEPEYDYFNKIWYKTAKETGKACWVDPFDDYTEGTLHPSETIASYCKPIRQKDGTIVGVISTDLSFKQLAETINMANQTYLNAYFVLLGGDGHYFIHPDSTSIFRKTIFTDRDPSQHPDIIALGHEMTAGKEGSMHITVKGELYHVCYRPIPGTDWSLALICPDSDILTSYHQLTYIISFLIVVGLLFILWLCYRVVKQTISPLNQLLTMSQKIADGNYDERIPTSESEDAIGKLQNSFAIMQQSLHDHVGSIREATRKAQRHNEELVHAMKLAEESVRQKNTFIHNVSHQIRTPLNIIQGFANVLRDSLASHSDSTTVQGTLEIENMNDIINTMTYNSHHLNRMVLMLFDSSDTGASEEYISHRDNQVICNSLARECISYTQTYFPQKVILFETDSPDDFSIKTNHLYLMRTLRELLYNAAKYSAGKHISLRFSQTETTVRFTVEDVGPGMPKEAQDLVFKPFTKIDDLSEGLGLGLPLAKRHAIGLGGDLILDTSYHDGCRFILEIPK